MPQATQKKDADQDLFPAAPVPAGRDSILKGGEGAAYMGSDNDSIVETPSFPLDQEDSHRKHEHREDEREKSRDNYWCRVVVGSYNCKAIARRWGKIGHRLLR